MAEVQHRPVLLGRSVEGRPIEAYVFPASRSIPTALVFGGFHGDEPKAVFLCRRLIETLAADPKPYADVRWVVVPVVNPDGYAIRRRRNARRVDLNRNFPTDNWADGRRHSRMFGGDAPGSEPETQAVMRAVNRWRPGWIITLHSIGRARHCNNYDGPGRRLAAALRRHNGYPVRSTIGYPTPGSFGAWAGVERGIPTVTLELPSLHSSKRCWDDNREAILRARP